MFKVIKDFFHYKNIFINSLRTSHHAIGLYLPSTASSLRPSFYVCFKYPTILVCAARVLGGCQASHYGAVILPGATPVR